MLFRNLSRAKRIACFASCAMILAASVVWYEAKKAEWDARSLLQDSLKFRIGESSAQDVLAITRGSGRVTDRFKACTAEHTDDCYIDVAVENKLLKLLHLAPDVGLGGHFAIKNNILVGRHLQMVAVIDGVDLHAFVTEEQASV